MRALLRVAHIINAYVGAEMNQLNIYILSKIASES